MSSWFRRPQVYSRSENLERAARARERGNKGRAIAEYRKVLSLDPGDIEVHSRLAPLLASKRLYADAWTSFRTAAEGYHERGFVDRAVGVYRQAARAIPNDTAPWEAVVRVQMDKGLKADAVHTLIDGSSRFKGRAARPDRIKLLRLAFGIAPLHPEVTYDLALSLARSGEKKEALELLTSLAGRLSGRESRRVRRTILFRFPSTGAAWSYLKAAFSRS